MKKATLLLEDGTKWNGTLFGADKTVSGETVFNTGMMGYPETMTDPSYEGQILVFTYPMIGNYGVPDDKKIKVGKKVFNVSSVFESSRIHVSAIIVSEYSENFSHFEAKKSLDKWMKEQGIPGITGIDTRALTKHLREKGAMLGKVKTQSSNLKATSQKSKLNAARTDDEDPRVFWDPNKENLVAKVSLKKPIEYKGEGKMAKKRVVCMDCGVKNNSIRAFLEKGVTLIRVPYDYDFVAKGVKFDGLFLSNGPGDPSMMDLTVAIIKKVMAMKKPIFGICLGNQLLSRASGAKTYKLKYGHRSQNQPCMDLETKKCYVTSQNHGYTVDGKTLGKGFKVWFENVNDKTVEGVKHKSLPFFAVQFHPEACPGPKDSEELFGKFIDLL
ncbi:MAG: carbamoyl-phosphate synthase, small subunit, carbamoyl-phosphate synthase small subunit [Candidatus Peregrinibacteria bacterium GW2011_GWF2_38_29]|nr:MAG: carbamoyl-phosphate synthase, small subunit, carbamoyl-phosphate synthase small subunit [Candidatus Peregrinibacteria bacterium GW2011_GWF2_38_29]